MHHAFLTHGGPSLWLEVTLSLLLAVLLPVAAELLARYAESGTRRDRPTLQGRSEPVLTTDLAHG